MVRSGCQTVAFLGRGQKGERRATVVFLAATLVLAATFLGMVALSVLAFGISAWTGFFDSVLGGVDILGQVRPLERMPSVFVAASLVGLGRGAATALQVAVALLMLAAIGWLWLKRFPMAIRGSALLFAVPLVTPYSFDYDLAVLTVALAWLLLEGGRRGVLRREKVLLAVLWVAPIAGWLIANQTGVQLTPLILLACVWSVMRAPRIETASS